MYTEYLPQATLLLQKRVRPCFGAAQRKFVILFVKGPSVEALVEARYDTFLPVVGSHCSKPFVFSWEHFPCSQPAEGNNIERTIPRGRAPYFLALRCTVE